MREGWETKNLGELCAIARGGSPRPIKQYLTDDPDGINWIKIGDATASTKYIFRTREKIKPEGVKRSRMVHDGDFLLSNSMSFGRPYIMKTSGCIHDGWLVLSDKSGLFNQDYLYHFLGSGEAYRQFDSLAYGSTVRNLNIDLVRGVEIPLPPLPEQARIVAILDEAFAAIAAATANAEKNVANARELVTTSVRGVLTRTKKDWCPTTIGEQMLLQRGFDITKKQQRPGNVPVVSSGGIKSYHSEAMVRGPGVVIGRKGSIGSVHYVEDDFWPHDTTLWVKDFKGNKPRFAYHFFSAMDLARFDSGAANPALNRNLIHPIAVTWPPKEQQEQLACWIDEVGSMAGRLADMNRTKLTLLTELRQSILHKAFTGELTADPKAVDRTLSEAGV